jgi:hypothetical protein
MVSGECKKIVDAAAKVGLARESLSRALSTPHVAEHLRQKVIYAVGSDQSAADSKLEQRSATACGFGLLHFRLPSSDGFYAFWRSGGQVKVVSTGARRHVRFCFAIKNTRLVVHHSDFDSLEVAG